MNLNKKIVQSFGLWQSKGIVFTPENYREVKDCVDFAVKNQLKVALKGNAMSFSSVCLAKENEVLIDLSKLNKILEVRDSSVVVQGGARIFNILKILLVKNKMIGSLSGSIYNSVAGNIGSDINGKDSWHFGNFSSNVISMKIMSSSGEIITSNRTQNYDLFQSVVAGLGLTGIILEVELSIFNIPSPKVEVYEKKVSDIDEMINTFINADKNKCQFMYAWLNPSASEKNQGQGIVYSAHFTSGKSITKKCIEEYEKKLDKNTIFRINKLFFWKLMRVFYTKKIHKLASSTKFFFQRNIRKQELLFFDFQYPMIQHLPDWNLYFYPHGFTELHILFPIHSFKKSFQNVMTLCREYKIEPFTLAIRRHKKGEGHLSFGEDALSFTLNYSRHPNFVVNNTIFEQIIKEYCIKHQGQLYLSKYPYLSKVEINKMYPEFDKFLTTKKKFDESGLFVSHAFNSVFFD